MASTSSIDPYIGLAEMGAPEDGASSRVTKARSEKSVVVPVGDEYGYCTGEYLVFSESGSVYSVNIEGRESCECMDMTMNSPSIGCKHINRVGIQMTEGRLPKPDDRVKDYVCWLSDQHEELRDEQSNGEWDGDEETLTHVVETLTDIFAGEYNALANSIDVLD